MKRDADMKQLATPSMDTLEPLEWAKKPRSQWALDFLRRGAELGDSQLAGILSGHKSSGVCDGTGRNLRKRWDGLQWVAA